MAKVIKLSEKLVADATLNGAANGKSLSKQIEYWASIGKIVEENPDLPFTSIKDILIGMGEMTAGEISDYEFG